MNNALRSTLGIVAISAAGWVLAQPVPPAKEVDLGAMKLKKATPAVAAPATAAPAANPSPGASPSVAPRPASAIQAAAPAAQTQQAAAPTAAKPNDVGIGNVVGTAPIGRRSASDILGQSQQSSTQQQQSGDLQVKMPSMFKKVNP